MRYLGIDYGLKKVGLAVSEGELARPLSIVQTNSLAEALSKVQSIIDKEMIDQVIIGISEGKSGEITRRFAEELRKNVEVLEVEETLSTQKSKELMLEMGISQKKRRQDDAYSAALILQNFLDSPR